MIVACVLTHFVNALASRRKPDGRNLHACVASAASGLGHCYVRARAGEVGASVFGRIFPPPETTATGVCECVPTRWTNVKLSECARCTCFCFWFWFARFFSVRVSWYWPADGLGCASLRAHFACLVALGCLGCFLSVCHDVVRVEAVL